MVDQELPAHANLESKRRKSFRSFIAGALGIVASVVTIWAFLMPHWHKGRSFEIEGRVLDRESGEPIEGAVVSLEIPIIEVVDRVVTDPLGSYRFSVSPELREHLVPGFCVALALAHSYYSRKQKCLVPGGVDLWLMDPKTNDTPTAE